MESLRYSASAFVVTVSIVNTVILDHIPTFQGKLEFVESHNLPNLEFMVVCKCWFPYTLWHIKLLYCSKVLSLNGTSRPINMKFISVNNKHSTRHKEEME